MDAKRIAALVDQFLKVLRPIEKSAAWAREQSERSPSSHQEFVRQADDNWRDYERVKDELEAALRETGPEWTTWQPIATAPQRIHSRVLLWWTTRGVSTGYFDVDEDRNTSGWRGDQDLVIPRDQSKCTHWMPLPKPPAADVAGRSLPNATPESTGVRLEKVANDLRDWINETPLPPTSLHPVYSAHVLLCSLIESEIETQSALATLQVESVNLRLLAALKDLRGRLSSARAESIGTIDSHRSAKYSQAEITELDAAIQAAEAPQVAEVRRG